ncbi:MAG: hypothetical protein CVV44_05155 [Spirochaetae bacterium HGW-Spirochaetae-1]|jgi:sigma-B regulation protein RsbU (phosphoserine phosphatase)|nr:MAG: hypothetical protein CVV44_05155 [Spirochaetae bacterium HGW-Spirochaetae-1]
MNIVSLPVACMTAVSFYVGLYYSLFYLRRQTGREDLFFALTCFSTALYDIFCFMLYNAGSVEEGIVWQRLQFASIALMSISIIWFIRYYAKYEKKPLFIFSTVWFGVLFILGLVVRNDLTLSAENSIKRYVKLGSLTSVTYYEANPGLIYVVEYASLLLGFVFIIYVIVRHYAGGFRRHATPLLVAMGLFFAAAVNDILVGMALYPFVYLIEYAFMLIVLSMAYVLQGEFLDLYHEVSELNRDLENKVKARTEELESAMEELESVNDQLIHTNKNMEEAQRIAKIDMDMAVNVQTSMLPQTPPLLPDWDIALAFLPMSGISGDFYDFYIKNNVLHGLSLFDVSGHGIASGLITLLSKSILVRNFSAFEDEKLGALLEKVNAEIEDELENVDNYLCGIVLRFSGGTVEYVNAGHPDLFVRQESSGKVVRVRPNDGALRGMPVGIKGSKPVYDSIRFNVNRGDILLLFTDGLLEGLNADGQEFGMDGIKNSLKNTAGNTAREILDDIMRDFNRHIRNSGAGDDIAVMVLRKK